MGHTTSSQRIVADLLLKELSQFAKVLRKEDRETYLNLIKEPLKHLGSISYVSSQQTWAFLLLAILLEQQKKYERLAIRCIPEQQQDCVMD